MMLQFPMLQPLVFASINLALDEIEDEEDRLE